MCANFILQCGENHYGFFLRCPTSFYNRPSINEAKKKKRKIVLALIVAGLTVLVLCAMIFGNKEDTTIPMEKIEGSDVVTVDDFEMDW